ncbi:hypothetical protein M0R45_016391 [Rubus argutus]|uniref:Uncharacterized protein n=1 Tax=Rubus argutus TaxID=59490 RepID=A0AAW1XSD2_RUBAR
MVAASGMLAARVATLTGQRLARDWQSERCRFGFSGLGFAAELVAGGVGDGLCEDVEWQSWALLRVGVRKMESPTEGSWRCEQGRGWVRHNRLIGVMVELRQFGGDEHEDWMGWKDQRRRQN